MRRSRKLTLEISALCESGFLAMISLLCMREKTMKAFMGLFTWFGGCFFVCKNKDKSTGSDSLVSIIQYTGNGWRSQSKVLDQEIRE